MSVECEGEVGSRWGKRRKRRIKRRRAGWGHISGLLPATPAGLPSLVVSGVSQLHLGAELGPAVGPVEALVADAEEPLGEAQAGHEQGDTQEEQYPLAHAGLLRVQVHAQEVDAAGIREGAFRASWARKQGDRAVVGKATVAGP